MIEERRRFKRISVKLPVRVYTSGVEGFIRAEISNISEGGAFLKTSFDFKLGQKLLIELPFPKMDLIHCKVSDLDSYDFSNENSVVRHLQKNIGLGVEFVNLSQKTLAFIRELVSKCEDQSTT